MVQLKKKEKIELGLVTTPPKTAEYIISRLLPLENKKILDPCVGPGIFIKKLLEAGVRGSQIQAFDINSDYKNQIEAMGVNFKKQDYLLSFSAFNNNEFDTIIGNPPYLNKASQYVRKNKSKLQKIYGKINSHETYSMFIVNSIWRLKDGGKLGFITSDSFLTLRTHAKLRKFILDNCLIKEILLAPKNLFDSQNVSTSPAILILQKCQGIENEEIRQENMMRIIPRISSEEDYINLKDVQEIKQKKYDLLPFNLFFSNVEEEIIELFEKAFRLEEYIKGYIGMHTHDNLKYIAAVEGTELADIFKRRNKKIIDDEKKYKIISEANLQSGAWKPYLKRGGGAQYYRPLMEALDWGEDSIPIYDIPRNVPFEEEGIVISGVSSRLAVRYMPEGCYWDSNKAIGFIIRDSKISIEYALGLLNSSLYNYLAKGIINNTNSIQISGIHALPFILPDNETKEKVEQIVQKIMENKKKNLNFDYKNDQKIIDEVILEFYSKKFNFPRHLKEKLDSKFSVYKNY
ncbi:MAG: Eco57I restriction-modification methylase domain-containing protein [Promethearchaeota archaeon]